MRDNIGTPGGRRAQGRLPLRGGGYLDICIDQGDPLPDPRLDDLRKIGLNSFWMRVAEDVGVDLFLPLWYALDRSHTKGLRERVYIPKYNQLLKYQRNRFIRELAAQGLETPEIQARVSDVLCERVSERHIDRLRRKDSK